MELRALLTSFFSLFRKDIAFAVLNQQTVSGKFRQRGNILSDKGKGLLIPAGEFVLEKKQCAIHILSLLYCGSFVKTLR